MLEKIYSGKVRDIYDVGDGRLLMVASDRISVFDVILDEPVPDKGKVLTAMTAFWTELFADIAPTHLISTDPADFPDEALDIEDIAGRAMLVHRAEMLPLECIVRGYITGSAWKEYQRSGTMHGVHLPTTLSESDRLPAPMFTPSTKAETGHDENISIARAKELVGEELANQAATISLAAYDRGAEHALSRGIVIADTKFELGMINGRLSICDEILTPDSSRFWPEDEWKPGSAPPSYDKQPVRDWAESTGWNKESTPPSVPPDVIAATRERYIKAYELLSGRSFAAWWPPEAMRQPRRFHVRIEVSSLEGMADPEGKTIERALPALGFSGVNAVRVGKTVRFELTATDARAARRQAEQMCARLLANPVIENSVIEVIDEAAV